jgi:hypothetical protein
MDASDICQSLVCSFLAPGIVRQFLGFWKICVNVLTSYSRAGKVVVVLSLFLSGCTYKNEIVRVIYQTSFYTIVLVTPQECFVSSLWSSMTFFSVTLPLGESGSHEKHFVSECVLIGLYILLDPSDITRVILAVLPDLPDQSV